MGLIKAGLGALGGVLADKNIQVSIHAPYFISMSSLEEEKRLNSVNYILQSATALDAMGGRRVIFHSGSCAKLTRQEALAKAMDTMGLMMQAIDDNGIMGCFADGGIARWIFQLQLHRFPSLAC